MKTNYFKKTSSSFLLLLSILFIINCSSDDSSEGNSSNSNIVITGTVASFGEVNVLSFSDSQSIQIKGSELISNVLVSVSNNFEISLDDVSFSNNLEIDKDLANANNQTLYVRFSPSENALGSLSGFISLESNSATERSISLNGVGLSISPTINLSNTSFNFPDTAVSEQSGAVTLVVNGDNLVSDINLNVSEGFEISFDDDVYQSVLQIPSVTANDDTTIYVRFAPVSNGDVAGVLTLSSTDADDAEVSLSGFGLALIHNYVAFNQEPLGFGGGFDQSAAQVFDLHTDISNIAQVKMYLQIDCPSTGCDDWDRFANIKVKDPSTGNWFEIGRYITPYWVGTQQLERGLEFDVTDFKALLVGATELRIYIENWTAKADLITLEFDFIEGVPDYPYYAVSEVLGYHVNSIDGVPYGVSHSFDLDKQITIPGNAESTHLRSVISGWGHATPNDSDGRPCAEWCYRTHNVKIDGANTFIHNLEPIGCSSNPISNQSPGNWTPDRAGWCPGMAVPIRVDNFTTPMAGSTFAFEYDFEDWTSDGANGGAYYATSTYVVVKSNSVISAPTVAD